MTKFKQKGIVLILIGVGVYFLFPYIFYIPFLEYIYYIPFTRIIAPLIPIVFGIKYLIQKEENLEEIIINQTSSTMENNIKNNKVVNVTLKGGLIGMLADSPQNTLNRRIKQENEKGWKVIQIIPSSSGNILLMIFRVLLLIVTFTLFTTANGYYLIMEKE